MLERLPMPKQVPIQALFAQKVARLILYIESQGYHVTLGALLAYKADGRHTSNSKHYVKLAIDLNLFDAEWNYLTETESHLQFGEYWESQGGTWGGRWLDSDGKGKDGNHYSIGETR